LAIKSKAELTTMATIDFSAWDASKAWSAGAKSDNPAAFYRAICAGRKAGDTSKQEAWALPYRYSPSSPPNAGGVRAALSRLSQTDGLTNKSEAQGKLERLMSQIQAAEKNREAATQDVTAYRSANPSEVPGGEQRVVTFPSEMRGNFKKVGGRNVYEVEGYATVYNRGYRMFDRAGEYTEFVDQHSLDVSLAGHPDVAFLANHKGITMARTRIGSKNPTMTLASDDHGLLVRAMLNADRQDVKDLAFAIDDGDVDEMSFAFMIEKSAWNDDFTEFRILEANIDRGDVSAVNYGANPYTTIMSRASDMLRELEYLPPSVLREISLRLTRRDDADAIFGQEFRDAGTKLAKRYEVAAEFNIEAAARAAETVDEDDMADVGDVKPPTEKTRTSTDWATRFDRRARRKDLRHRLQDGEQL
jgi:HK97 family phage prohead protease